MRFFQHCYFPISNTTLHLLLNTHLFLNKLFSFYLIKIIFIFYLIFNFMYNVFNLINFGFFMSTSVTLSNVTNTADRTVKKPQVSKKLERLKMAALLVIGGLGVLYAGYCLGSKDRDLQLPIQGPELPSMSYKAKETLSRLWSKTFIDPMDRLMSLPLKNVDLSSFNHFDM